MPTPPASAPAILETRSPPPAWPAPPGAHTAESPLAKTPDTPDTLQGPFHGVTEIVLERNGEGQPQGLRVRLGRDGRIEHTRTGHARFGTADETRTAALSAGEFEALVQLLRRQRFSALQPVYDDPETAGGAWALLRVTHAHGQAEVWWRAGQRPAAVQPIEAAVLALGRRAGPVPQAQP